MINMQLFKKMSNANFDIQFIPNAGNKFQKIILRFCLQTVFFLIFIGATHAAASSATPSSNLVNLLNSVRSMQANFTQIVYDNRGKQIQQSYGRMAMMRPGKFRWEITRPIPQLIIANESRLWIYDSDLQQVTVRSLKQAAGETPALLLSDVNRVLDKGYTVKQLQGKSQGWRWFVLIPRNVDNMFASIQMGFMNGQIHEMRLQDHLGHTTMIQFRNARINTKLSFLLFTFKPPAHVDIIDETRLPRRRSNH